MTTPLVSVIVPCYNQAIFLPEALDSVLAQKFDDWECIIVNDGATDDTEAVGQQYAEKDTRFKYVKQTNVGLAAARNFGIAQSAGEFVLPLDADDSIHPDYLQKAVDEFNNDKSLKLVYCNARKFGAQNSKWHLPDFDYFTLLTGNIIFCSSIYKKGDFIAAGKYDETMRMGLEDWDLWIRLLDEKSKVKKLAGEYFFYRIKDTSMNTILSSTADDIKYYIYLKNIDIYRKFFKSPITMIEENTKLRSMYKNSVDYKIGNFLLNPLRKLANSRKK